MPNRVIFQSNVGVKVVLLNIGQLIFVSIFALARITNIYNKHLSTFLFHIYLQNNTVFKACVTPFSKYCKLNAIDKKTPLLSYSHK